MNRIFKTLTTGVLAVALLALPILFINTDARAQYAPGTLISQQFGDASTVTFTPGSVATGKMIKATVNGVNTSFFWASSTTLTFYTAPADKSIINFVNADKTDGTIRTKATIDFASTGTLGNDISSAIAAPGALAGDPCSVGYPTTWAAVGIVECYVDASDSIKATYKNHTSGTVNPASSVFYFTVRPR